MCGDAKMDYRQVARAAPNVSSNLVRAAVGVPPFWQGDPGIRAELRMPDAAAQTRIVSVTGIRLDSRESERPFKGIFCDDISEFESYMPSQAV
jgi:hypothetical protein